MINSGQDLKKIRATLGISQAKFAEITGIQQYALSAFELGNHPLDKDKIIKLNSVIKNISDYTHVISRKKRYRKHTYKRQTSASRAHLITPTDENPRYIREISDLSNAPKTSFTGLSLFAGIGGLSLGFKRAGCDIKGYIEIDDGLAKVYEKNFPNTPRVGGDITKVTTKDLKKFVKLSGAIDCVIGGPPCQGFSLSGKRDIDDPRNYLFQDYLRVIDAVKPKFAIVENVRLLTSMRSKDGRYVKDVLIEGFKTHGYHAKLFEINAIQYGVPQHRERVIFVAVRDDISKTPTFPQSVFGSDSDLFVSNRAPRTFADACSDLPFLESGETSNDTFHTAVSHPDHVIHWLWDVKQGYSAHDNIDPNLRPPSGYNTTYKRQIWEEPAATVQTTFGMISGCRNVHPIATRSLTIREAARLQSFPDDFKLLGTLGKIRTGIGNAVPPLLARAIAEHVASQVLDFVKIPRL